MSARATAEGEGEASLRWHRRLCATRIDAAIQHTVDDYIEFTEAEAEPKTRSPIRPSWASQWQRDLSGAL